MKHILLVALVACSSPATKPPPVTPSAPPPAPPAEPAASQTPPASTTEPTIDPAPIESDAKAEPKPAAGPAGAGVSNGGYGYGRVTKGRYGPMLHGRVSDVKPVPQPTREKVSIRHEIKKHIFAIQVCYDKALDTKPDLAGTVNTTFTIEPDGLVSSASASGVDPDVASCVANEVKTIQFPTAEMKTVVNYPFVFRPPLP